METIIKIEEIEERGKEGYAVTTTQQKITLLIDNGQCCCENWGYFWCNDNPMDFIGSTVLKVSITDSALNEAKMKAEGADNVYEGGVMFINIETCNGQLQFVAYNEHNGYYGHEASILSKQLNYSECL